MQKLDKIEKSQEKERERGEGKTAQRLTRAAYRQIFRLTDRGPGSVMLEARRAHNLRCAARSCRGQRSPTGLMNVYT